MTRGRKKDLTIPPTRSLVQQRDYRARKANYIASLEERCRKAEEENVQLRKELVQVRAHLTNSAVIIPETAEASNELMQALAVASASLSKFQQLAFAGSLAGSEPALLRPNHGRYEHEMQTDRQTSQESTLQSEPNIQKSSSYGRKRLFREDSPLPPGPRRMATPISSPNRFEDSECCGGILDCDALDSDGVIEEESEEYHRAGGTRVRLSELRSTTMSGHRSQA
ncbi:hypothetical protein CPB84DRAFT_1772860 [Gymnopilus junonius]|uniref:BZIP domain-containing protein n=1 Tax=Gymnopilus junonius TaxID=109634 RepID=A0A9P5TP82_GYMJU|nr:hypothetical protein CPB84DRAFT_1772860 [Gymnopilus junonius]